MLATLHHCADQVAEAIVHNVLNIPKKTRQIKKNTSFYLASNCKPATCVVVAIGVASPLNNRRTCAIITRLLFTTTTSTGFKNRVRFDFAIGARL